MTSSSVRDGRKPPGSFVGRECELTELCAALDEITERGRVFLISGEPGIGKTRLSDELSAEAQGRGFRVVWGRCWEDAGTPAYWPFIQVVRACLGSIEASGRLTICESEIAPHVVEEVAQIVPELRPAHSHEPRRSQADPETARFRLFDAVAHLLKQFARARPMLIVIDDLHEADQASLEMLSFVAREFHDANVVFVATCRDAEMRRSSERLKLIEEILHEGNQIPLAGLAESEVARMIEARGGRSASERLAARLHWLSRGNPLFVDGLVRVLAADGKLAEASGEDLARLRLPDSIRSAIRRRLALLSDETRSMLSVASAIGQEFELVLLASITELSSYSPADDMSEAAEAGIIVRVTQGRYRFTHPLIREALYTGQKDSARSATHRVVGEALEQLQTTDLTTHLPELAYHFREGGVKEKAVEYSVRAGDAAYTVFAYEDARSHWETALELMNGQEAGDKKLRARILSQLTDELLCVAPARTVEYLQTAARLFEELGDDENTLRAHSRLGSYFSGEIFCARDVERAMRHFRKAETILVKAPESESAVSYYVTMAASCSWSMRIREGLEATRRAMEISGRRGWDGAWSWGAILSSKFLVDLGAVAEGLGQASMARQRAPVDNPFLGSKLAQVTGLLYLCLGDPRRARARFEPELSVPRTAYSAPRRAVLHDMMTLACIDQGDLIGARKHLVEASGPSPRLALIEGDWDAAEKLITQSLDRATATEDRQGEMSEEFALAQLHRTRGEYARAEESVRQHLAIAIEAGDVLEELRGRPELTLILHALGHEQDAIQQLERCREILGGGEDWRALVGLVARAEAVVAGAPDGREQGEELFKKAIAVFRQYTLPFEEAETLYYWGRALIAVGDSGANEKFDAAIEIYRRHGAGQRWIERVEEARPSATAPRELGAVAAAPRGSPGVVSEKPDTFVREGEFWTITYDGRMIRLKDTKGLRYLAYLLSHQGERFPARDLVAVVEGWPEEPASRLPRQRLETSADLGDVGPILDDKAKANYRRRRQELRKELDEAEAMNDSGRAERARTEMEMLEQQLSAAIGLGGRDRKGSAHAERARLVVTRNIRAALGKIGEEHPPLGRHFYASIKTGYLCTYLPAPESLIVWNL